MRIDIKTATAEKIIEYVEHKALSRPETFQFASRAGVLEYFVEELVAERDKLAAIVEDRK